MKKGPPESEGRGGQTADNLKNDNAGRGALRAKLTQRRDDGFGMLGHDSYDCRLKRFLFTSGTALLT